MESHSVNFKHFIRKLPFFVVGLTIIAIGIFLFASHRIVVINGELVLSNARSYENHDSNATDKDLENLKYLSNLERLWLFAPQITDISFVSGMTDLKSFSVESQNIANLDLLKNCEKLEILNLFHTNLTNLNIFARNTELRVLDISTGNPVQDISGLQQMGKLEQFSISSSELTDISPIGSLSNLAILEMSCGSVNDISPLIGCQKLKHLSLGGCKQVTDIYRLAELKNLEESHVFGTAISDFTPLLSMESLKKVVASDGQINSSILAKLEAQNITVELL